jgi:hypothetical protein
VRETELSVSVPNELKALALKTVWMDGARTGFVAAVLVAFVIFFFLNKK